MTSYNLFKIILLMLVCVSLVFFINVNSACGQDSDEDGIIDSEDNCPFHANGPLKGTCTNGTNGMVSLGQFCTDDAGCDSGEFCEKVQADTYPPGGNNCGDACECEGDFDWDTDVDLGDSMLFLQNLGRTDCTNDEPCYGDFDCDGDVDGEDFRTVPPPYTGDSAKFKEDLARKPCPDCSTIPWCTYITPTVYPQVETECPEVATACPPEQTHCPVENTVCPVINTQCPAQGPTICPEISTQCPVVQTQCPLAETLCPLFETLCPVQSTFCPILPTECPNQSTYCPLDPTQCEFTVCMETPTYCFPIETNCPFVFTTCPVIDTACPLEPSTPTVCPEIATECPVVPTVCQTPEEPTVCPENLTYCPLTDSDGDGVLDCNDNSPDTPNGPLLGTCAKRIGSYPNDVVVGVGAILTSCTPDGGECGEVDFCEISQEDSNSNGCGDAGECFADITGTTAKVDLNDLVVMKDDFLKTCPPSDCTADLNGDSKVDLYDLIIMKTQYLRTGCPC